MANNTPIIFMQGGCIEEVDGVDSYIKVDWDALESGCCPVCGEGVEEKAETTIETTYTTLTEIKTTHPDGTVTKQGLPPRSHSETKRYNVQQICHDCEINWTNISTEALIEKLRQKEDKAPRGASS